MLINHDITYGYDTVMKTHLRPGRPLFEKGRGGNAPVISPISNSNCSAGQMSAYEVIRESHHNADATMAVPEPH